MRYSGSTSCLFFPHNYSHHNIDSRSRMVGRNNCLIRGALRTSNELRDQILTYVELIAHDLAPNVHKILGAALVVCALPDVFYFNMRFTGGERDLPNNIYISLLALPRRHHEEVRSARCFLMIGMSVERQSVPCRRPKTHGPSILASWFRPFATSASSSVEFGGSSPIRMRPQSSSIWMGFWKVPSRNGSRASFT